MLTGRRTALGLPALPIARRKVEPVAFALLYNGDDSQAIQDSYQAARTSLSNNDRQNIDAVWNAGLSAWNSDANRVYNPGPPEVWSPYCFRNGSLDRGLCDTDTHLIPIDGVWARSVAAYGAVAGQPITRAGFSALMHRMADADPDGGRRGLIHSIADDLAASAREPYP